MISLLTARNPMLLRRRSIPACRVLVPMLAVLATLLAAMAARPTAADAALRVGLGAQDARTFSSPLWRALSLERVRYVVAWDALVRSGERTETDAYMTAARAAGQEVLVSFTAHRGCWNGARYSRARACRAPSAAAYRRQVRRFLTRYPEVRVVSPWNEANHPSQPTAGRPGLAARYYNVARTECRGCTIVAVDVLDQGDAVRYVQAFRRQAHGSPRLWGLHNYSDVNRRRSTGTRRFLASLPGTVWLTETGGIVRFARAWPYSPARAGASIRYMFSLASAYSRRRSGMRSHITRVYAYQWLGESRSARFDAGLVNPDGSRRPGYTIFRRLATRHLP